MLVAVSAEIEERQRLTVSAAASRRLRHTPEAGPIGMTRRPRKAPLSPPRNKTGLSWAFGQRRKDLRALAENHAWFIMSDVRGREGLAHRAFTSERVRALTGL